MICGYPVKLSDRTVSCGRCMPCRINHKRMWVGRMIMEMHECRTPSTFLTLTYNPEHLPEGNNLDPKELKVFHDNLRRKIGGFRFYAVGEYGSKTQRPHYHGIYFGLDPAGYEEIFRSTWTINGEPKGNIMAGVAGKSSLSYVANYVTKKMTTRDHPDLYGRQPEFFCVSKFPPLGYLFMLRMLDSLHTRAGAIAIAEKGSLPNHFRHDGKIYPLGKYYAKWLYEQFDWTSIKPEHLGELDSGEGWALDFEWLADVEKYQWSEKDALAQLLAREMTYYGAKDNAEAQKQAELEAKRQHARDISDKHYRQKAGTAGRTL